MIDIVKELAAIHREVARRPGDDGPEVVAVRVRRSYPAQIEDVWDAITDPDRLKRWFYPISGELEVGGSFQLEGNAGGDILRCEPPRRLKVTFGGEASLVEVRLSGGADADAETVLELEHTVPVAMAGSGAGALFVGPGWDGALMGLAIFLRGEAVGDPLEAANSPQVQRFNVQSAHAWAAAVEASGTATADEVAGALQGSLAHFAPDVANEGADS